MYIHDVVSKVQAAAPPGYRVIRSGRFPGAVELANRGAQATLAHGIDIYLPLTRSEAELSGMDGFGHLFDLVDDLAGHWGVVDVEADSRDAALQVVRTAQEILPKVGQPVDFYLSPHVRGMMERGDRDGRRMMSPALAADAGFRYLNVNGAYVRDRRLATPRKGVHW